MGFFKTLQMILSDIGQWFSIRHYQYMCGSVLLAVVSSLFNQRDGKMGAGSGWYPHLYNMIHFTSFVAVLGTQLWVILVAGMTMFFILPRHIFGRLQTFMFPMFFFWCLVFSGVALVTFNSTTPSAWDRSHYTQVTCLAISVVASCINGMLLAPRIIESMVKTFQLEVEVGAGNIVGHAVIRELAQNPEYVKSYRLFRRFHAASAMLNVISLVANLVYLHLSVFRLVSTETG